MNAHVSVATSSATAALRASTYTKPTHNERLTATIEQQLHETLLGAMNRGDAAIDTALETIAATCRDAGQTYFVTKLADHTKATKKVMNRKTSLGLRFGFYWTDNGIGNEAMVPAPRPRGLPPAEQDRLTALLRNAVQVDAYGPIDRSLREIAEACAKHKVARFVTPYRDRTATASLLIGRLRRNALKLFLGWTEDGLDGEVQETVPVRPAKVKPSRAEIEARTAANRAKRHAAQPARGASSKR